MEKPGRVFTRVAMKALNESAKEMGLSDVERAKLLATINVTTPGDAGAAAKAIAGMQNTVNAEAIRNMQAAAH